MLSFLLATKNRRELLPRAIGSVLAQTDPRWELVVLDNGESIRDLVPGDPRIVYDHCETTGPADAFQKALERSTGDLLMPLGDDDWLAPQTVSTVISGIGNHEWGYAVTAYTRNGETIDYLGGPWSLERLKGGYYLGGAVFWRRSLSDRLGGFDTRFDGAADFDLYLRFGMDSEPIYLSNDILYYYNDWPGTDSRRRSQNQQEKSALIGAKARGEL